MSAFRGAESILSRGLLGSKCVVPLAVEDVSLDVQALVSVDWDVVADFVAARVELPAPAKSGLRRSDQGDNSLPARARRVRNRREAPVPNRLRPGRKPEMRHTLIHDAAKLLVFGPNLVHSKHHA